MSIEAEVEEDALHIEDEYVGDTVGTTTKHEMHRRLRVFVVTRLNTSLLNVQIDC